MSDTCIGYIIDLHSPFEKDNNVVEVFKFHNQEYCIRRITQFKWGQPVIPDKPIDSGDFNLYRIYNTVQEAKEWIAYLRRIHR